MEKTRIDIEPVDKEGQSTRLLAYAIHMSMEEKKELKDNGKEAKQ